MTTTTFLVPDFDSNILNKINQNVEVTSKNVLSIKEASDWYSAIATNGFPSKKDGVYVYVTRIDNIGNASLNVGFTDMATYDSTKDGAPGHKFSGTSLNCFTGNRWPGYVNYLLSINITRKAKEIISILTISNNGTKKAVQWIVDGNEGLVVECTNEEKGFGNGDEIFPCVSFGAKGQQVTMIPLDQGKSRSPKIDQLMQEFNSNKNRNQSIINQAPSTSTAQND